MGEMVYFKRWTFEKREERERDVYQIKRKGREKISRRLKRERERRLKEERD
jgi:DNA-binding PadR family transcriptional regulator